MQSLWFPPKIFWLSLQGIISDRRQSGKYKLEQNNFIDSFLLEIDNHKEAHSEPNHYTGKVKKILWEDTKINIHFHAQGKKPTTNYLYED